MEFTDVIRDRYSCKSYDGRKVEPEKLERILEAGRLAPTAKNLQEQHIYVIQSDDGLAKIDNPADTTQAHVFLLLSIRTTFIHIRILQGNQALRMHRSLQRISCSQRQTKVSTAAGLTASILSR